jgi:hypothetical protein
MDIELSQAVEGLRDELLEAAVSGAGSQIAFAVGPIELEFTVELKTDVNKTGFKAWVVTAGAEAGVSRGRTHKVKVTLTPKHPDGSDVLIAGRPGAEADAGGLVVLVRASAGPARRRVPACAARLHNPDKTPTNQNLVPLCTSPIPPYLQVTSLERNSPGQRRQCAVVAELPPKQVPASIK